MNHGTKPDERQHPEPAKTDAEDLLAGLRCTALASGHPTTAHVTRVLVTGGGEQLGKTILELFPDHDVALVCTREELQRLERDVRLLLFELVAENELELLDQCGLSRVTPAADGRCEVCVGGPEESCSLYDRVVVCGQEVSSCAAPMPAES